jgi:hypothetical protein
MTRLIDADALRWILNRMANTADHMDPPVRRGIEGAIKFLDAAPTLRCDGCKHEKHTCMRVLAADWSGTKMTLDFCSLWEAK